MYARASVCVGVCVCLYVFLCILRTKDCRLPGYDIDYHHCLNGEESTEGYLVKK